MSRSDRRRRQQNAAGHSSFVDGEEEEEVLRGFVVAGHRSSRLRLDGLPRSVVSGLDRAAVFEVDVVPPRSHFFTRRIERESARRHITYVQPDLSHDRADDVDVATVRKRPNDEELQCRRRAPDRASVRLPLK